MTRLLPDFQRGVIAMCAALLPGLLAWLALGWDFAPARVAERIMEATPAEWAVPLMGVLGILAKPWAVAGGVAVMGFLGGLGAVAFAAVTRKGYWPLAQRAVAAALLALALTLFLFPLMPRVEIASFVPIPFYAVFLFFLVSRRAEEAAREKQPSSRLTRRDFLRGSVASGVGLAGIAVLGGIPIIWRELQQAATRTLFAFQPPAARSSDFENLQGLTPEVTPADKFYVMSKTALDPRAQVADWKLRVGGHVERPFSLTLEQLISLPRVDQFTTLECVSNPVGGRLMSTALWSGVRLADLLLRAGVRPGAQQAVFFSLDSFSDSIPFDLAQHPDTLIAYAMNGAMLAPVHGGPARLLAPGRYGFKNVKWLERIELVDRPYHGRWQDLGWTEEAIVKATSRIDTVRRIEAGLFAAGVAFAGTRGIGRVEIRADEGEWQEAELHNPPLSGMTWVQWRAVVAVPEAKKLTVRASDGQGGRQVESRADAFPSGSSGWHTVEGPWGP